MRRLDPRDLLDPIVGVLEAEDWPLLAAVLLLLLRRVLFRSPPGLDTLGKEADDILFFFFEF